MRAPSPPRDQAPAWSRTCLGSSASPRRHLTGVPARDPRRRSRASQTAALPSRSLVTRGLLLFVALWLHGCAEQSKAPLTLEMRALKPSYWKNEPYIIEYQISNLGAEPIAVNTDFQGVHRFSFLLGGHKYMFNQTYPSGGMDFGERSFVLKPNEQLNRYVALDGWMKLSSGNNEVTGGFDTKNGVINSTFTIHVTPDSATNEIVLDSWYLYYKAHRFDEPQSYEFIRCIASVCVKNKEMEKAAILLKNSADPDKRKFYGDLLLYTQQSWDAID